MSFLSGPNTVLTRALEGIDRPPAVPNAMDDEFYGSSLDGKWTWLDQGGAAALVGDGRLTMTLTENANRIRGIYQAAPSGSWTFRSKVYRPVIGQSNSHSTLFCGQGAGASDDQHGLAWFMQAAGRHFPLTWASPSSSASAWIALASNDLMFWCYYELAFDGVSTATVRMSNDGVVWTPWASQTLSYTPAIVGLGIGNNGNELSIHQFDWFRRVA